MSSPWHAVAWLYIALSVTSAAVIAIDILAGHRQRMAIMNLVWPLTALYAGPLGLAAYFDFGRRQHAEAGNHHHHEWPLWQSALLGTTHCGAGCMLGDVLADTLLFVLGATAALGSVLLTSYVFDFVAAFVFGITFQYFTIAPRRKLRPAAGLAAALKADALSLVAFQVGMYVWMGLAPALIFGRTLEASSPLFWFMMQIGMVAGIATSFPMNWWLVKRGTKERM